MKINWKLRLQNKTTLITLCLTVLAFVYQILGLFDVVPSISEDTVATVITTVINFLAIVGIVVDPTTEGVNDSARALEYSKPNKGE